MTPPLWGEPLYLLNQLLCILQLSSQNKTNKCTFLKQLSRIWLLIKMQKVNCMWHCSQRETISCTHTHTYTHACRRARLGALRWCIGGGCRNSAGTLNSWKFYNLPFMEKGVRMIWKHWIFSPLAKKFLFVSSSLQSLLINFHQAPHFQMHASSQKIPSKTAKLPSSEHITPLPLHRLLWQRPGNEMMNKQIG